MNNLKRKNIHFFENKPFHHQQFAPKDNLADEFFGGKRK